MGLEATKNIQGFVVRYTIGPLRLFTLNIIEDVFVKLKNDDRLILQILLIVSYYTVVNLLVSAYEYVPEMTWGPTCQLSIMGYYCPEGVQTESGFSPSVRKKKRW